MSAFEVSTETIQVLVNAGIQHGGSGSYAMRWYWGNPLQSSDLDHETAERVGAMLAAENVRSVNYRYQEDELEQPFTFRRIPQRLDPIKVLSVLSCYEYQTCETDDWRETEAYRFCEVLRAYLIHALPGYGDGPWDVTDVSQCFTTAKVG